MSALVDTTDAMSKTDDSWLDQPDTETQRRVERVLKRIQDFCTARTWSEGYFGKVAVGDDLFVPRLRRGKVQVRRLASAERYLDAVCDESANVAS